MIFEPSPVCDIAVKRKFMEYPKRGNTGSLLWAAVTMVPEILSNITFLMPFFPPQERAFIKIPTAFLLH